MKHLLFLTVIVCSLWIVVSSSRNCLYNENYSNEDITISCWEQPPFISHEDPRKIEGVMWTHTQEMLSQCCPSQKNRENCDFWFQNEYDARLNHTKYNSIMLGYTKINYEILDTELNDTFRNDQASDFLSLVVSPGFILIPKVAKFDTMTHWMIIKHAWPLLITIFVSTGFAGIIVWFLERNENPMDFPRSFIRGFWEGCWWAFVSMTTVGYGDRCPKSILGRLFSLVWIIFGLVMISIFTATITTTLSAESITLPVQHRIKSVKVDVLKGSYENILAIEYGFDPQEKSNVSILIEEDKDQNLEKDPDGSEAVMMENFMFIHLRKAHDHEIRRLTKGEVRFTSHETNRGLLLTGFKRSAVQCMQSYTRNNQFLIYHRMASMQHSSGEKHQTDEESLLASELFAKDSIYRTLIMAMVLSFLLLCLILWEYFWWRPRHRLDPKMSFRGQKPKVGAYHNKSRHSLEPSAFIMMDRSSCLVVSQANDSTQTDPVIYRTTTSSPNNTFSRADTSGNGNANHIQIAPKMEHV